MDALTHSMSRDEFFAWAEVQELRHEFDGFAPVPMTGGNISHNRLILNVLITLRELLVGTALEVLGPEAGVATVGDTVRYPDAVVTRTHVDGQARLVPDPVAVFEVVSPTSVRVDRIVKVREYAAVPSILHYVIVESDFVGVSVLTRLAGRGVFEAEPPVEDGLVVLPGIGVALPVADIYRGVFTTPEGQP